MQRVVFNANYFVYVDDAVDTWTRHALADELAKAGSSTDLHAIGFDFMLKTTQLTWHSPVKFGDTLDMQFRVGGIAALMLRSMDKLTAIHDLTQ
jgi:acyl-CoA thioesterase FadM